MDRIAANALLVRVVETGSFSRAAADLKITQPTATKTVAALEARLGARLLNRNTRGVGPTEIGSVYYDKCKAIQTQIDEADNLPAPMRAQVAGRLRVGTSVAFGRRVPTPLLMRFMTEHLALAVDPIADDRYVDLVAQGIDVAIRMGRLADSSLGARYLGTNPWLMVAAPAYVQQAGTPRKAAELKRHQCLVYSSVQGDDAWHLTDAKGRAQDVPVRGPLRSNNLSALRGAGVAQATRNRLRARRPRAAGAGDARGLPVAQAGADASADLRDVSGGAVARRVVDGSTMRIVIDEASPRPLSHIGGSRRGAEGAG